METRIITLTKELAIQFLADNPRNRNIKTQAIQRYADDMLNGRWVLNGESLKFDDAGHLLDGQNRCNALLLANQLSENGEITIETFVVEGLPRETQDSMDGPVRRSVSDQLAMRGFSKYTKLAAALRIVSSYDKEWLRVKDPTPPRMRLISLFESDPDLFTICNDAEEDKDNSSCINASVRVAVRYILLARVNADADAVDEFFEKLALGTELSAGDPILTLRTRQQNVKQKGIRQHNNLTAILVLRTWNYWRKGEKLYKLQDRNPLGHTIIPKEIVK